MRNIAHFISVRLSLDICRHQPPARSFVPRLRSTGNVRSLSPHHHHHHLVTGHNQQLLRFDSAIRTIDSFNVLVHLPLSLSLSDQLSRPNMKRPSPPPPPPKPLSVEHLLEQHHQPSTSTGLVGNVVAAPMSKNRSRSITTTASSSSTSLGVINPVFVSDLVEETNTVIPLPAGNRTTTSSQHPHNSPVHSAKSSISFDSSQGDSHHHHHHHHHQANNNQHRTVTTAAASSSSPSQHRTRSTEVKQPLGGAFDDDLNCDHCHRYHASHHLGSPTKVPEVCSRPINYQSGWSTAPFGQSSHLFAPPLVTTTTTPSPPPIFSPASYYLLGSDSRRHKHTHYHRNCRTCRQIVRETFERYYLQNNYTQYLPYQQTMVPMSSAGSGTTSRNSNGSAGSIDTNNNNTGGGGHYVSHNARASLLNNAARYAGRGRSVPMATTPPMVTLLPR